MSNCFDEQARGERRPSEQGPFLDGNRLLVAEPITLTTIRTQPGYSVARHTPKIFQHTVLTDTESAPALPAKKRF